MGFVCQVCQIFGFLYIVVIGLFVVRQVSCVVFSVLLVFLFLWVIIGIVRILVSSWVQNGLWVLLFISEYCVIGVLFFFNVCRLLLILKFIFFSIVQLSCVCRLVWVMFQKMLCVLGLLCGVCFLERQGRKNGVLVLFFLFSLVIFVSSVIFVVLVRWQNYCKQLVVFSMMFIWCYRFGSM